MIWVLYFDAAGRSLASHQDSLTLLDAPSLAGICRRVAGAVKVEIYVTGRGKVREWPEVAVEV